MLNPTTGWTTLFSPPFLPTVFKHSSKPHPNPNSSPIISTFRALRLGYEPRAELGPVCCARRRVRYEEEEEEEEEYEYNKEIAMLELYTQSAPGEAVLVHALLDQEEVEVLIFKGFSSCLSHGTSPDPSRSVVPATAVIKSIDRIKGPFDPCNIEYLEKDLNWDSFKARLSVS
ncbi:hypothetical protein SLE2022_143310 [Rubroshorea leprosula]